MLDLEATIIELQDWLESDNDDPHIIFLVETAIDHMKEQRSQIKALKTQIRGLKNRINMLEGR